jgi:hypothetical protein
MNDLMNLFFHLTPTTLAAIVADLDGDLAMTRQRQAALQAGCDNMDDFFELVVEARAERDGQPQVDGDPKSCDSVAAILARQA